MQPFLAMIIPVGSGGGGSPPGIWGPTDPRPTPPIYWPGFPGGGGGGSGARPEHPIFYPPGIWGPTDPRPGWGLPGQPPGIWGGGNVPMPNPPIYIPPAGGQPPLGIWGPPDMPPGFWGGGMGPGVKPQPHPEHPIVLPPDLPPETEDGGKIDWKVAWTPTTGWIVVGIPTEPHPAPSAKN